MCWTAFREGRTRGGYRKLRLFESQRLKMDGYLIHYPAGSYIAPHVDAAPLAGYRHQRINIILKKPRSGGKFHGDGRIRRHFGGRIIRFSPDYRHAVTPCEGSRWVLSIGWLTRQNASRRA